MNLKLINGVESVVDGSDLIFDRPFNESLIHQLVVAYQANARSVSSKQKDREEVSHSTKKPWKQKGTGRARAGMSSSPLWRGGGRIFPNSPDQNYSHKVNRKMYRVGMCSILSELVRNDRLVVVDNFKLGAPKTKLFVERLKEINCKSLLVVLDQFDEQVFLASRNLVSVLVLEPHQLNPVSLVQFEKVMVVRPALKMIEEMLS